MTLEISPFFHKSTSTFTYVVADRDTGRAAVIDPALDYDPASGRTGTASAHAVVEHLRLHGCMLEWILETHAHADHLSAAQFFKQELGGRVAIGEGIRQVQQAFKPVFNLGDDFRTDGSQFDRLFRDGEIFHIGGIEVRVMATPGHTSDSVTYVLDGAAFVGDTLFMPDSGTARCDFPGGDAGKLYDSIQRILSLPDRTRLFMCHDYGPGGREIRHETSVAEEKRANIHVKAGTTREQYIALRDARDATLSMPALILPAIQVNIRAGHLPAPDGNGVSYLRIPLNRV